MPLSVPVQLATMPFSSAIIAGEFVFVSGQLALREGICTGSDITVQTHVVLDNIEAILIDGGLTLDDVVKMTVWLTRAEDFPAFNAAYGSRFDKLYPARSTTVAQLLIPGALVEIEAIAHRRPVVSAYTSLALAD